MCVCVGRGVRARVRTKQINKKKQIINVHASTFLLLLYKLIYVKILEKEKEEKKKI